MNKRIKTASAEVVFFLFYISRGSGLINPVIDQISTLLKEKAGLSFLSLSVYLEIIQHFIP